MSELAASVPHAASEQRQLETQVTYLILAAGGAATAPMGAAMVWLATGDHIWQSGVGPAMALLPVGCAGLIVTAALVGRAMAKRWFADALASASSAAGLPRYSNEAAAPVSSWRMLLKDPATGLFSQSALLTFADDAIAYFRRYKRDVSVLMLEIDVSAGTKSMSRGEGAEPILRHVAEILDLAVRKTDKVARFGTNRYVILLREISEADTLQLAERIRVAVADLGLHNAELIIPVTVSVGAAVVAESDLGSGTLIRRAETALLASKTAGGNCVTFQPADQDRDCHPAIFENAA